MRGTVRALCLEPPPLCLLPPSLLPPPPFGGLRRPQRGRALYVAWGAPLAWGAGVGWQVCWGNAPDTRGGVTGSSLGSREKGARARVSEWTAHTARRQQGPPWGDHRLRGRWRDLRVRLWEPPRGAVAGGGTTQGSTGSSGGKRAARGSPAGPPTSRGHCRGGEGARPPGLGAEGHCGLGTPGCVQSCTATRPGPGTPAASPGSQAGLLCAEGGGWDPRPLELEGGTPGPWSWKARGKPAPHVGPSRLPRKPANTARTRGPPLQPPLRPPSAAPTVGLSPQEPEALRSHLQTLLPAGQASLGAVRRNREGGHRAFPAAGHGTLCPQGHGASCCF